MSYNSEVKLYSSGKSLAIMSKSSCRETELNIFVRSTKTAARVGDLFSCWGWSMNRSIDICIVFIMKSIPLGTPTAKLYGSKYRANLSFHC